MFNTKLSGNRRCLPGIAVALILLLGLIVAAGCSGEDDLKTEQVTVQLDWTPNTNYSGLYVAKEKGYYREEGLEVKIEEASGSVLPRVAEGKAQFGISFQEEVTFARESDEAIPVVSIGAIVQHNTSGFASLKEKGITGAADFEGKRYGSWGYEVEEAMIAALMDKYGGDPDTIEIVTVGEADLLTVIERLADFAWIYYGWDGIAAELKGADLNFVPLRELDPMLDYYTPVIITSESLINEEPELIERFMRATARGYQQAMENPAAAAEILLESAPELDGDLVKTSQEWLKDKYQADADRWGWQKKEVWENYSRWLYEHGLVEKMPDVEKAFTNRFIP